ncbi:MAG: hypothetical protein HUK21_06675 [Fibrobacteraceae bacterium]|nr:hypothetical protein [Fibrobacteraceae bacterium]
MIRLNLIDAAERSISVDSVSTININSVTITKKSSKKKALTILVAALFVVVAFSCFLSVAGVPAPLQGALPAQYLNLIGAEDPSRSALSMGEGGQTTMAGGSLEAQRLAAEEAIKRRESVSIKQVVGEINPQALFNNKRTDYSSYLPLEKLSYARSSMSQFLAFLNTATPDDVGFSDLVYQAPNYYYARGVATKASSQRAFLDRLKSVSTDFKTPPLPENAPATDITAFGCYNVTNASTSTISKFVSVAELNAEVKALQVLAGEYKVKFSGFDKPVVEDFGVYKRYTYKVSSTASFQELQTFIASFADSPVRIGIQKAEMKLARKDMVSALQFVTFVVP